MSALADSSEERAEQETDEEKRTLCMFICKVHLIHSSVFIQLVGRTLISILSFNNFSVLFSPSVLPDYQEDYLVNVEDYIYQLHKMSVI